MQLGCVFFPGHFGRHSTPSIDSAMRSAMDTSVVSAAGDRLHQLRGDVALGRALVLIRGQMAHESAHVHNALALIDAGTV